MSEATVKHDWKQLLPGQCNSMMIAVSSFFSGILWSHAGSAEKENVREQGQGAEWKEEETTMLSSLI